MRFRPTSRHAEAPGPLMHQDGGGLHAHRPGFRDRVLLIVGAIMYCFILLWNYSHIIGQWFQYTGYVYHVESMWLLVFGLVAAVAPAVWIPLTAGRVSTLALCILFLFVHVPSAIAPYCTAAINSAQAIPYTIMLVICSLVLVGICRMPMREVKTTYASPYTFWTAVGSLTMFGMGLTAWHFGLQVDVHALDIVYEVRDDFADGLRKAPRVLAYLLPWMAHVLAPLIIAEGIRQRSLSIVFVGVVIQLMLFSLTGFKSFLFSLLFLFGIRILLMRKQRSFARDIVIGWSFIIAFCGALDMYYDGMILSSLFVRRMVLTPGILSAYYHDFFLHNPKLYLSHSVLSPFFEYPYNMRVVNLIGLHYLGREECSANVNFLGSGFANFGYMGMLGVTVVFGFVLWLIDCVAARRHRHTAFLLFAMPVMALVNSALPTVMLTHGLGLAVVLLCIMPENVGNIRPCQPFGAMGRPSLFGGRGRPLERGQVRAF